MGTRKNCFAEGEEVNVLSKNVNDINFFSNEIFKLNCLQNSVFIAQASFCDMNFPNQSS